VRTRIADSRAPLALPLSLSKGQGERVFFSARAELVEARAVIRALVALLALALPLAAPASEARDREVAAMQALEALAHEEPAQAEAVLAPFAPFEKAGTAIRYAAGALRFHQQRYAEAVELLDAAGKGDPLDYRGLAHAARDITKDHARAEGEHFVVSYPRGKDEVLVPYLLETLEAQRAALLQGLGTAPPGKVTVEILTDAKQLAQLSTLDEQSIRTTGTVAVAKFNKLMVLSPKALLKGYDWLDTAAHEFTHNVITLRTGNRAPLWMQEGLAKWFEQSWRGRHEPLTPFSAALLRDAAGKKKLVTFAEMNPSFAKLPTPERAALAYAQVALAVELLAKQKGPDAWKQVTGLLADGKSSEEAVAQVAGVPFRRFLEDWTRYMGQRPLPRGGEHELQKLRFKDDPRVGTQYAEWAEIPDEESRGFARLGEIFRARGRWSSARLEYAKAYVRVGARIPILSERYAVAATQAGAKAEAEKVLSEALAWNPDYPALNVQMSRLLFDRGQLQAARDHLLAANRQDPFDPEIHAGLARILASLGDKAGAERETRFTRILTGQETPPP
jgi:tetratricopeptide (TPR) repeat protein